jgi:hypothetical protein
MADVKEWFENMIAGDLGITTVVVQNSKFIQTQIERYQKAEIDSYNDLLQILQTNKEA